MNAIRGIVTAPALLARRTLPIGNPRGFTLIELVVTMIVVGILAFVVVPRFSLLRGYDEVGYRDKVKAALEFARKSAVAQRRYACVNISANDATLTIETVIPESTAATCPRTLSLPVPDKSCSGGETNKVCHPNNVTLTPNAAIRFDPLGRPVSGAGTYSVIGDSTLTVTLETETGYVH